MTVDVTASIARCSLIQCFYNPADIVVPQSTYAFPLYNGAVVSSFRCTIGDEEVLEGPVKPTSEAQAIFKRAVARRENVALLQVHTPEVFEVQLGNLPPRITTKIEITYVQELKADIRAEGLSLTIPTSVAPRYVSTLLSRTPASSYSMRGGLKIIVNIDAPASIRKIASTTHPISVEIGHIEYIQTVTRFSDLIPHERTTGDLKRARASLSDRNAALGKDFVLTILATDNRFLGSQALWRSPLTPDGDGAMMVSLDPREFLSKFIDLDKSKGEIILLADRSRSMESKTGMLRDALVLFLQHLPLNVYFNIISFGSNHSALWPESQIRSVETYEAAIKYLRKDSLASTGDTEILSALRHSFMSRRKSGVASTGIIVITDGAVWDAKPVTQHIRQARTESGDGIRYFALGVGDSVSHELIEGIGIAGGGFGEIMHGSEIDKRDDRITGLLHGALSPDSWSCRITPDLTRRDATKNSKGVAVSAERSEYIQAPINTSGFHSYQRQSIFFLLKPMSQTSPEWVTVQLSFSSGKNVVISIPVMTTTSQEPTIHILAAKAILSDLENGQSCLHSRYSKDLLGRSLPATQLAYGIAEEAERLGVTYGVASQWTTFVATESRTSQENAVQVYRARQLDFDLLIRPTQRSISVFDSGAQVPNVGRASLLASNNEVEACKHEQETDTTKIGGLHLHHDTDCICEGKPSISSQRSEVLSDNAGVFQPGPKKPISPHSTECLPPSYRARISPYRVHRTAATAHSPPALHHATLSDLCNTAMGLPTVSPYGGTEHSRYPSDRGPTNFTQGEVRYHSPVMRQTPRQPQHISRTISPLGTGTISAGRTPQYPPGTGHNPHRTEIRRETRSPREPRSMDSHAVASRTPTSTSTSSPRAATLCFDKRTKATSELEYCPAEQGTAVTAISSWMAKDSESCMIFWICGAVRLGKSMVLRRVVQEQQDTGRTVALFDFSGTQARSKNLEEFLTNTARELARSIPEYQKLMSKVISTDNFKSLSVSSQWRRLIMEPFSGLSPGSLPEMVVFAIDNLDQCHRSRIGLLLELMRQFVKATGVKSRILIASTESRDVCAAFLKYSGIHQRFALRGRDRAIRQVVNERQRERRQERGIIPWN